MPRIRIATALALVGLWLAIPGPASSQSKIDAGWDLFATGTPTGETGIGPMQPIPIGFFDFGGTIGSKNVGNTDTIVQRLSSTTVTPVGVGIVPIELVSLHLVSVTPINYLGNGLDFYYLTPQSDRGGPASTGTYSITFNNDLGGTFSSQLDLFYDIHKGALNGPIVASSDEIFSGGSSWGRVPPLGALAIPAVNLNLDGTDNHHDFWMTGANQWLGALNEADVISLTDAVGNSPEPGAIGLVAALLAAAPTSLLLRRRRKAR